MALHLDKPWLTITDAKLLLRGNLGVYQLADAEGSVLFIGYAGGKSRFGLKGEVMAASESRPAATHVRWEVTTAYLTRYKELLMLHEYENGQLPPDNPPVTLGKLRPAG